MNAQLPRLWSVPYHPVRALLLERGVYLLLALDAWMLMLEHGGRYGLGGFNVAHFDFLDRLLPLPDPALYLGLVSGSGLLACVGALGQLPRIGKLALLVVYTTAWAISMHDSYQHHYLLSWFLGFFLCLPSLSILGSTRVEARGSARERRVEARESEREQSSVPLVRGAGLPLCAVCCVVLYTFTAISKSSQLWRSGAVLRALARSGGPLAWAPRMLLQLGLAEGDAWHFAAILIASTQLIIAVGFVACIFRDSAPGRGLSLVCSFAWAAAVGFHLFAELDDSFAIGWFSYYMLWVALVLLGPSRLLVDLLAPLAWLVRQIPRCPDGRVALLAASVGSSLIGFGVARTTSLPGVSEAVLVFVMAAFLQVLRRWRRADARGAFSAALLPGLGCVLLSAALSLGDVRFDYYRLIAGELSHMGQLERALLLYRKAEQYAPAHDSRRGKIEQLEQQIARKARLQQGR